MTTASTPATNETKPEATATPAPAADKAPGATPANGTQAPPASDPKATGTAPATPAAPAPAAEEVDDGIDSILDDIDDDAGESAAKADGEAPAEDQSVEADADKKEEKPVATWAQEREAAADAYIAKIERRLSTGKDGKPLSPRQRQANIDDAREKFLDKLSRYKSLTDALIAGINAQDKISSGKYKAPLPEDATDEEIAAWRKENGIPEDAKGYKLPKIQGQEWTEADKPGLDKLLSRMHEKNASQAQVDAVLSTYKEVIAEAQTAYNERLKATDKADTEATREYLREEFAGEFKPAMTLLKRLVNDADVFPDDAGKMLAEARTADGHRLINNPAIARFLINYAREVYGEGSMIAGDQQAAMNTEEQELVNLMKTNIDEYNYGTWKTTGMRPAERLLEIRRKRAEQGRGRRAA